MRLFRGFLLTIHLLRGRVVAHDGVIETHDQMCVTSGARVRRVSYAVKTSEATEVGVGGLQLFKETSEVTDPNTR
jgi:hypothetical protein